SGAGSGRRLYRACEGGGGGPYAVVARLGQRLEGTLAPDAVLPTLVETVAQALKLPYVAVMLRHGDEYVTAAETGDGRWELGIAGASQPQPLSPISYLPLTYQGETVGKLLLAPRAAGESFSPADRRLLAVLAQQAGVAAHTVRLTTDLQRMATDLQHSREHLITARE